MFFAIALRGNSLRTEAGACRGGELLDGKFLFKLTSVARSSQGEIIYLALYPKLCSYPRIPSHRGGASRSSRTSGAGCGGRIGSQRGSSVRTNDPMRR